MGRSDDFKWASKRDGNQERPYESRSYWRDVLDSFLGRKVAVAGVAVIFLIAFMAVAGPHMSGRSYDSQEMDCQNLAPRIPYLENIGIFDGEETVRSAMGSQKVNGYLSHDRGRDLSDIYYWFGSDGLGRDIFTRTWMGARISLYIALCAVLIDMCFGAAYGLISGYYGGRVDQVMQRVTEVLNGIPTLVVVTLLILVFRPGVFAITAALALTGWINVSKVARAQALMLKEREFVLASRTLGAGKMSIIFRDILPNVLGQLVIVSMFSVPNAIFTEAFLAFIGLGVPVPLASLGTLINDAFRSMTVHPYMIAPPVIVLAAIMLSFNLTADGLKDALDLKKRGDR